MNPQTLYLEIYAAESENDARAITEYYIYWWECVRNSPFSHIEKRDSVRNYVGLWHVWQQFKANNYQPIARHE